MADKNKLTTFLLLILILGITSFFRLYKLDSIPPGLYPDVAINGNDALQSLRDGQFKLFYLENNGREGLMIWLVAGSFLLFGTGIWSMKIVAAIAGILTVLGLYLLAKELFEKNGRFIALLSSFFLAVSFWHVNFSRIGFRAILIPFVMVFAFYFFAKGFKTGKMRWLLPAGLFFAAGFYTYTSFRLAVLLLFTALLGWFLNYRRQKNTKLFFRMSAALLAVIFLASLPVGIYFLSHPQDFLGRAAQTSIFSAENPLLAFFNSFALHLSMFNIYGDGNWRHNYAGSPQLLWPVGILFLAGLFITVKRLSAQVKVKDCGLEFNSCLLLASWFFFMLLPGILTREGIPHALRTIGVIPAVFIFAGIGGFELYSFFCGKTARKKLLAAAGVVFICLAGGCEFHKYFFAWAQNKEVGPSFTGIFVDEGKILGRLPKDRQKIVVVNEPGVPVPYPDGIPMPAQTILFIEQADCFRQTGYVAAPCPYPLSRFILPEELNKITINQKTVIMPMKYDEALFNAIINRFPDGSIKANNNVTYYETF